VKEHAIGTSEWIRETPCELAAPVAALSRAAFANPQVALYSRFTKSAGWPEGEHEGTNPKSRRANSDSSHPVARFLAANQQIGALHKLVFFLDLDDVDSFLIRFHLAYDFYLLAGKNPGLCSVRRADTRPDWRKGRNLHRGS
jgi:hypothetical protein